MDIEFQSFDNKSELFDFICEKLKLIAKECDDKIAILSNLSALIMMEFEGLNWAGFYLLKGKELVLGPFQGKPAVAKIPIGKGVCGTAVLERKSQLVENVHTHCNHIACDSATSSELVVPIVKNEKIVGVIDLDSPITARFDNEDKAGFEKVSNILSALI
ncbi:MAG: GAF domain-containing protein [[Eubacterium] siraeum]|nr:GAF domain-containing protein [[Eubacterium] siraeum]